ncbi:hypothetical protein [Methanobrevibacter sp.]
MLFKELLAHFEIAETFPDYLLEESFNEVFLNGDFSKQNNDYRIVAKTRKKVTHTMFIKPDEDYPVIVLSELPNGQLNGVKFGQSKDDLRYINEL